MSNSSFISQIFEFLGELFNSLDKGTLFFGSLWDFVRYAIDIALVTFLFYTLLLFIRQTRAVLSDSTWWVSFLTAFFIS